MRLQRIFLTLIMMALVFGCASKPKVPTQESLFAVKAYSLVEGLREAYVQKNFSEMRKFCSRDAYETIRRDIKKFDSVELDFDPQWMETTKDDSATMRVLWKGKWKLKGKEIVKTGRLILTLSGEPLKVTLIQWGSPFKQPEKAMTLPEGDVLK